MNVLPNVALHTVANWSFQDTLADSSGNGLDLSVLIGSEVYTDFGGGLRGFQFDDGLGTSFPLNDLIAPNSALFRMGGALTIEFLIIPRNTTVQTYLQCETSGGSILYAYYLDTGSRQAYADQHVNTSMGPPYTSIGNPLAPNFYAMTRSSTGTVNVYLNGTNVSGPRVSSANTVVGTERLRVGGFIGGNNLRAVMASLRILDTELPPADVTHDSAFALGPTTSLTQQMVYDGVAAAQFGISLRQSPRT